MNLLLWVIIMTSLAGVVGTGLGGCVGALLKSNSTKMVSLLLSFAAGIMLSVVCFDLILGAIEPEGTNTRVSIYIVILGILLGYGIIYVLNHLIDNTTNHEVKHIDSQHPKTADNLDELIHADHYEEHKKMNNKRELFIGGVVMACAIALHNLPEGMVIGASFASGENTDSVFSGTGMIMTAVIGLHNIPEGMAVAVPLISGGMKKQRAIFLTAFTGAPTIIGAIIGYMLGTMGPVMLSLSMSFASGAMLYVVLGELLPEAILMWKSKAPAFASLLGILLGLFICQ